MPEGGNLDSLCPAIPKPGVHEGVQSLKLRPAVTGADLAQLPHIFNYYIATTVVSFRLEPIEIGFFEEVLLTTTKRKLPFIVATIPRTSTGSQADSKAGESGSEEKVIGYAYALPFREYYPAYQHTVEVSLYIQRDYQSLGAGSALMDELLKGLRTAEIPEIKSSLEREGDNGNSTIKIRQVLSVMSFDTTTPDSERLEKFYARWGFARIGHLKEVGFKFGKWIDVLFLQLSL